MYECSIYYQCPIYEIRGHVKPKKDLNIRNINKPSQGVEYKALTRVQKK